MKPPGFFARFLNDRAGVSIIEFALIAPTFVGGFIWMADLALSEQRKMQLDQALRAGVQLAMQGEDSETRIKAAVTDAAPFPLHSLDITVLKQCECGGVALSCNRLCDGGPTPIMIRISAQASYETYYAQPRPVVVSTAVRLR